MEKIDNLQQKNGGELNFCEERRSRGIGGSRLRDGTLSGGTVTLVTAFLVPNGTETARGEETDGTTATAEEEDEEDRENRHPEIPFIYLSIYWPIGCLFTLAPIHKNHQKEPILLKTISHFCPLSHYLLKLLE